MDFYNFNEIVTINFFPFGEGGVKVHEDIVFYIVFILYFSVYLILYYIFLFV